MSMGCVLTLSRDDSQRKRCDDCEELVAEHVDNCKLKGVGNGLDWR